MPYNLHIIKTSDFVRLSAKGSPDLQESFKVLSEIARTCIERGINCALLDVRDLYSQLSVNDLYWLAHAFHDMGFRKHHCLAVLHRYGAERAEIFATFAADEGWNVRGFENYEEAIEWFTTQQPLIENDAAEREEAASPK
jgi:hypothetical protein